MVGERLGGGSTRVAPVGVDLSAGWLRYARPGVGYPVPKRIAVVFPCGSRPTA